MNNIFTKMIMVTSLWLVAPGAQSENMNQSTNPASAGEEKRVVLIGASIGQEWNLPDLPRRMNVPGYAFEAVQAWQYDKSEAVEETLMRPSRKFRLTPSYFKGLFNPSPRPADVIILKECSSYFPSDISRNKALLQSWIEEIRKKNITVMLATIVPVTKERARRQPGKQEGIREFNDWLRDFARQQGLPLLDLERALRKDDKERYLRDDLTSGDGSHLNQQAYDILDRLLIESLSTQSAGR